MLANLLCLLLGLVVFGLMYLIAVSADRW